ncbi:MULTISPECIES: hypothetical protein [Streptomyces]|jgi:hypothetical protein|uniref:hypothetical protein n=1 Tax=Streptomyces TaxID=1883 RepID=UPI0004CD533C|nr:MULTISPECIES: hypothetical protein [Streptomyces]
MFTRREYREPRRRRSELSEPYWRQRGWQVSAAFLGVVVLLSGIVALTAGRGTADDRAGAPPSKGPLSGSPAMRDGRPDGCRTDDGGGDVMPTAPPGDVDWRTLGVTRVPVSASAGPTLTQGPVWWCFAHTPAGAVLAAHIIPSHMSGPDWRTVAQEQVVPGRGRDLFVFKRSTVRDDAPGGGRDTGSGSSPDTGSGSSSVASYAGFSVPAYSGRAATVELLLKTAQGYATTSVSLRWSGGDWKVQPSDNGALHTPVKAVQGTNGHLLWGV